MTDPAQLGGSRCIDRSTAHQFSHDGSEMTRNRRYGHMADEVDIRVVDKHSSLNQGVTTCEILKVVHDFPRAFGRHCCDRLPIAAIFFKCHFRTSSGKESCPSYKLATDFFGKGY